MSSQYASPQASPPPQSSLSFTQGFLLGQLSVVLFIAAFIKFFIFGEPPSPETTAAARALARRNENRTTSPTFTSSPSKHKTSRSGSHVLRPPPRLTAATILSKTYYNVHSHPPESLDWFNVLIAQTIAQFRTDAHDDDAILSSLTTVLNGPQKPSFLSSIKVTEISLGEEFPILSNCRIHPVPSSPAPDSEPRLQARMDVDLSDFITLGIETKIILNYPKASTAVLPITLAVSIVRFSGTLTISFLPSSSTPPPSPSPSPQPLHQQQQHPHRPPHAPPITTPTTITFSLLPDYRLDISVRSLVGSRSRLQDIPKIAQLVETRLHAWIDERCVEPRVQQVVLPSFWPRRGNMRKPGGGGDGTTEGERSGGLDVPGTTREGEGMGIGIGLGLGGEGKGFASGVGEGEGGRVRMRGVGERGGESTMPGGYEGG